MKKLLNVMTLSFLFSQLNFASAQTGNVPVCDDDLTVMPCLIGVNEVGFVVSDMLFDNAGGFEAVKKKAKIGFQVEEMRVTVVSETLKETQMKFELLLSDCRGTDACMGSLVWTVDAISKGDGYTYQTTYTDSFVAARELPQQ